MADGGHLENRCDVMTRVGIDSLIWIKFGRPPQSQRRTWKLVVLHTETYRRNLATDKKTGSWWPALPFVYIIIYLHPWRLLNHFALLKFATLCFKPAERHCPWAYSSYSLHAHKSMLLTSGVVKHRFTVTVSECRKCMVFWRRVSLLYSMKYAISGVTSSLVVYSSRILNRRMWRKLADIVHCKHNKQMSVQGGILSIMAVTKLLRFFLSQNWMNRYHGFVDNPSVLSYLVQWPYVTHCYCHHWHWLSCVLLKTVLLCEAYQTLT